MSSEVSVSLSPARSSLSPVGTQRRLFDGFDEDEGVLATVCHACACAKVGHPENVCSPGWESLCSSSAGQSRGRRGGGGGTHTPLTCTTTGSTTPCGPLLTAEEEHVHFAVAESTARVAEGTSGVASVTPARAFKRTSGTCAGSAADARSVALVDVQSVPTGVLASRCSNVTSPSKTSRIAHKIDSGAAKPRARTATATSTQPQKPNKTDAENKVTGSTTGVVPNPRCRTLPPPAPKAHASVSSVNSTTTTTKRARPTSSRRASTRTFSRHASLSTAAVVDKESSASICPPSSPPPPPSVAPRLSLPGSSRGPFSAFARTASVTCGVYRRTVSTADAAFFDRPPRPPGTATRPTTHARDAHRRDAARPGTHAFRRAATATEALSHRPSSPLCFTHMRSATNKSHKVEHDLRHPSRPQTATPPPHTSTTAQTGTGTRGVPRRARGEGAAEARVTRTRHGGVDRAVIPLQRFARAATYTAAAPVVTTLSKTEARAEATKADESTAAASASSKGTKPGATASSGHRTAQGTSKSSGDASQPQPATVPKGRKVKSGTSPHPAPARTRSPVTTTTTSAHRTVGSRPASKDGRQVRGRVRSVSATAASTHPPSVTVVRVPSRRPPSPNARAARSCSASGRTKAEDESSRAVCAAPTRRASGVAPPPPSLRLGGAGGRRSSATALLHGTGAASTSTTTSATSSTAARERRGSSAHARTVSSGSAGGATSTAMSRTTAALLPPPSSSKGTGTTPAGASSRPSSKKRTASASAIITSAAASQKQGPARRAQSGHAVLPGRRSPHVPMGNSPSKSPNSGAAARAGGRRRPSLQVDSKDAEMGIVAPVADGGATADPVSACAYTRPPPLVSPSPHRTQKSTSVDRVARERRRSAGTGGDQFHDARAAGDATGATLAILAGASRSPRGSASGSSPSPVRPADAATHVRVPVLPLGVLNAERERVQSYPEDDDDETDTYGQMDDGLDRGALYEEFQRCDQGSIFHLFASADSLAQTTPDAGHTRCSECAAHQSAQRATHSNTAGSLDPLQKLKQVREKAAQTAAARALHQRTATGSVSRPNASETD